MTLVGSRSSGPRPPAPGSARPEARESNWGSGWRDSEGPFVRTMGPPPLKTSRCAPPLLRKRSLQSLSCVSTLWWSARSGTPNRRNRSRWAPRPGCRSANRRFGLAWGGKAAPAGSVCSARSRSNPRWRASAGRRTSSGLGRCLRGSHRDYAKRRMQPEHTLTPEHAIPFLKRMNLNLF